MSPFCIKSYHVSVSLISWAFRTQYAPAPRLLNLISSYYKVFPILWVGVGGTGSHANHLPSTSISEAPHSGHAFPSLL